MGKVITKVILTAVIVALLIGAGVYAVYSLKSKPEETPKQDEVSQVDVAEESKETTEDKVEEEQVEEEKTEEPNEEQNEEPKEETEEVQTELFVYSSGDNAAVSGNPELLYVYKLNSQILDFKYHTPWGEDDVVGTASKVSDKKYEYLNGTYSIEFVFDSLGENSVKVSELENGNVKSWSNLFTNIDVSKYLK